MQKIFGFPNKTTRIREVLSRRKADVAEALRTFTLRLDGHTRVIVRVKLERVATTAITCAGYRGHTLDAMAQSAYASVTSGTMTLVDGTQSYPVSGNDTCEFRFDVAGTRYLKCVLGFTGGGATDFVTVYAEGC
jgi:hypothetical protein